MLMTRCWDPTVHISWCYLSSVIYPEIWRWEQISHRRYRISARDTASVSGDAVVSHWRCIISFRDAHPPHSHPHLPQETPHLPREMWSHLQISGYVTLLGRQKKRNEINKKSILKILVSLRLIHSQFYIALQMQILHVNKLLYKIYYLAASILLWFDTKRKNGIGLCWCCKVYQWSSLSRCTKRIFNW
jgi:hypothetical protein